MYFQILDAELFPPNLKTTGSMHGFQDGIYNRANYIEFAKISIAITKLDNELIYFKISIQLNCQYDIIFDLQSEITNIFANTRDIQKGSLAYRNQYIQLIPIAALIVQNSVLLYSTHTL